MKLFHGEYEIEIFSSISMAAFFFYASFIWINQSKYTFSGIANDIKTAIFISGTLLFLTPVLKSLTVAYSDDTILLLVVSKIYY